MLRLRFLPCFLGLLGFAFLLMLGCWQLYRAHEKTILLSQYTKGTAEPVLRLSSLKPPLEHYRYMTVSLRGHYLNHHNILLDNRTHQGRAGYHVLTPFRAEHYPDIILVNRGWIPLGADRASLPTLNAIQGEQSLQGTISFPNQQPFLLGKPAHEAWHWPARLQFAHLSRIEKALKQPVAPFVVLLSPKAQQGFVRQWRPAYLTPDKHRGYALQWFLCAIVFLILLLAASLRKRD